MVQIQKELAVLNTC